MNRPKVPTDSSALDLRRGQGGHGAFEELFQPLCVII
jgi:hypothetical protein